MSAPHVLFFSPYSAWHYHSAIEGTLARALAQRGAQVSTVLCDALFPACDVYRASVNPRNATSCLDCQAKSAAALRDLGQPYRWLGSYAPSGARRRAEAFAHSLSARELLSARYRGQPVGEWAASSAFYQHRMARYELGDEQVERTLRMHVQGTALALESIDALLDEARPDALVTLNGRFFAQRVAVELCRQRGIRFLTHERGVLANSITWRENALIHDLGPYRALWQEWGDVPLTRAELEHTRELLQQRRAGQGLSWTAYTSPPQAEAEVRAKLGIGNMPVIALFTSSDDEAAAFPEHRAGAFPDARDWLPATLELARRMPEHAFVIRIHPALVDLGTNRQALEHALGLCAQLPANCRMVLPEDSLSSYTLADMAEVGLVYFTTVGLEMAAAGTSVLAVARGWYSHSGCVDFVERAQDYEPLLRAALARGRSRERARLAHRFLHSYWTRLTRPFPLVREEPRHHGKLQWSSPAQLAPGRDAELDRACALILQGAPLWPAPAGAERARGAAEEDAFLDELLAARGARPATAADNASAAPHSKPIDEPAELIALGEAAFAAGDLDGAARWLTGALGRDQRDPRIWNDLGVLFWAQGLREDALECFENALLLEPGHADALANRAALV